MSILEVFEPVGIDSSIASSTAATVHASTDVVTACVKDTIECRFEPSSCSPATASTCTRFFEYYDPLRSSWTTTSSPLSSSSAVSSQQQILTTLRDQSISLPFSCSTCDFSADVACEKPAWPTTPALDDPVSESSSPLHHSGTGIGPNNGSYQSSASISPPCRPYSVEGGQKPQFFNKAVGSPPSSTTHLYNFPHFRSHSSNTRTSSVSLPSSPAFARTPGVILTQEHQHQEPRRATMPSIWCSPSTLPSSPTLMRCKDREREELQSLRSSHNAASPTPFSRRKLSNHVSADWSRASPTKSKSSMSIGSIEDRLDFLRISKKEEDPRTPEGESGAEEEKGNANEIKSSSKSRIMHSSGDRSGKDYDTSNNYDSKRISLFRGLNSFTRSGNNSGRSIWDIGSPTSWIASNPTSNNDLSQSVDVFGPIPGPTIQDRHVNGESAVLSLWKTTDWRDQSNDCAPVVGKHSTVQGLDSLSSTTSNAESTWLNTRAPQSYPEYPSASSQWGARPKSIFEEEGQSNGRQNKSVKKDWGIYRDDKIPSKNVVNLLRIEQGLDVRTTLMLKNVPNRATDVDLVDFLDEAVGRCYDFLYLRIDFASRCNVGYGFVNFTSPLALLKFSRAKIGTRWDLYRSDKIVIASYANIQGKAALIDHFRNSIVLEQVNSFRPKLFISSGPFAGEPEAFPECNDPHRKARSNSAVNSVGLFPTTKPVFKVIRTLEEAVQ